MKTLTVSRKWNNPHIEITVDNEAIQLRMTAEDFRLALIQEIGPVAMVFKQATFEKMVSDAFGRVINGVKEESAKVL